MRANARATAAAAFPDRNDPQSATILRRSAELDASIVAIAQSLSTRSVDLFVVYLPGLDIAQSALLGPSAGTLSTSAMAARVDALRAYYPFVDVLLGPLIEWREHHRITIVTQPGRVQTSSGGLFTVAYDGAALSASRSPLDVAPTILAALGLPLSRELVGEPMPFSFMPQAYRFVGSYGSPFIGTTPREGKPLDQEMIDRLRSLGYVK
jgi:hypothetical protein